jgi:hypothetical protein
MGEGLGMKAKVMFSSRSPDWRRPRTQAPAEGSGTA